MDKKGTEFLEHNALIFDIKRDCSEDGPGIRTTVFFKGCPLSCIWCQNPEGKSKKSELLFNAKLCQPSKCGTPCIDVCEAGCLLQLENSFHVDHSACTRCDNCFKVCPTKALEPAGYWISRQELLYSVLIDKPFYRSTNGGITLSGGEPTIQMQFLHYFLKDLKKEGIHVVLETCGFFNLDTFRTKILPYLDLIYFDLKLIDDEESRRYTGRSNLPILKNFVSLTREARVSVIPRIPLVPNITATRENLTALSHFLCSNNAQECSLIPYNPLWQDKLVSLGLTPKYQYSSYMRSEYEKTCAQYFIQTRTPDIQNEALNV
jgi:pyruvate formate lyase activating enzyme